MENEEVRVTKETGREIHKAKYNNEEQINNLTKIITNAFINVSKNIPIIIVCIGTDRSTGDSLGPMVGTFLKETNLINNENIFLYGEIHDPVHAMNLQKTLEIISEEHTESYILAIDASLGKLDNVGNINFAEEPVRPGAGVGKNLPYVGNAYITANVNVSGFMEYQVLQNTRLSLVFDMAKNITKIINVAYQSSFNSRKEQITKEKVSVLNGLKPKLKRKKREFNLDQESMVL